MLAREYCDHINRKLKPIILSHHMLYGLKAGQVAGPVPERQYHAVLDTLGARPS